MLSCAASEQSKQGRAPCSFTLSSDVLVNIASQGLASSGGKSRAARIRRSHRDTCCRVMLLFAKIMRTSTPVDYITACM